jgi:hypothetical protein
MFNHKIMDDDGQFLVGPRINPLRQGYPCCCWPQLQGRSRISERIRSLTHASYKIDKLSVSFNKHNRLASEEQRQLEGQKVWPTTTSNHIALPTAPRPRKTSNSSPRHTPQLPFQAMPHLHKLHTAMVVEPPQQVMADPAVSIQASAARR